MSEQEIDFGTVGSAGWGTVLNGVQVEANRRLQLRYDATTIGIGKFHNSADELIKEVFTKPPGRISPFGALVDIAITFCEVAIPEATVAKVIFDGAKAAYEEVKTSVEFADKVNEAIEANSVDEAVNQMQSLLAQACVDLPEKTLKIIQGAENAVEEALSAYVTANPLPFEENESFYRDLCDHLNIAEPDVGLVSEQAANEAFFPFKEKVLTFSAQRHFFHDLDDDLARLEFLLDDVAAEGTDPDAFLDLIGAPKEKYDPYIRIYRSSGRDAAITAFMEGAVGEGSEAAIT